MDPKNKEHSGAWVGMFGFRWNVPSAGYVWRDDLDPADLASANELPVEQRMGPYLVPVGTAYRQYSPLKVSDLHRRLADIARVKKQDRGILAFANAYGLLWGPGAGAGHRMLLVEAGGGEPIPGASLGMWRHEAAAMSRLRAWYRIVRERDRRRAQDLVVWEHFPTRVSIRWQDRDGAPNVRRLARDENEPDLIDRWRDTNPDLEPLRCALHREVNDQLTGHVNPRVPPYGDRGISLIPDSLVAALYVLFAHELAGWESPRGICRFCRQPFKVTDGRQRYCSARCRGAHWDRTHRTSSATVKRTSHGKRG